MSTDLTTRGQRIPDANCFGVSGSWFLVGAAEVLLIWRACLLRNRFEGPVDHAGRAAVHLCSPYLHAVNYTIRLVSARAPVSERHHHFGGLSGDTSWTDHIIGVEGTPRFAARYRYQDLGSAGHHGTPR